MSRNGTIAGSVCSTNQRSNPTAITTRVWAGGNIPHEKRLRLAQAAEVSQKGLGNMVIQKQKNQSPFDVTNRNFFLDAITELVVHLFDTFVG